MPDTAILYHENRNMDGAIIAALEHPIAYQRVFARIGGGICAGLLLSQMWYWRDKGRDPDGWIYKTQAEITDETVMTRSEQETARKALRERGLLQEIKKGLPAKLYYRVDRTAVLDAIKALVDKDGGGDEEGMTPPTRMRDSRILECDIPASLYGQIPQAGVGGSGTQGCGNPASLRATIPHAITETTTETTQRLATETTAETAALPERCAVPQTSQAVVFSTASSDAENRNDVDLITQMEKIGVSKQLAHDLLRQDRAEVVRQLSFWPHQDLSKVPNRVGFFRAAVTARYDPPAGMEVAQKAARASQRTKAQRVQGQAQARQEEALRAARDAARTAYWEQLPPPQRLELDAQVNASLAPINRGRKIMIEPQRWLIIDNILAAEGSQATMARAA